MESVVRAISRVLFRGSGGVNAENVRAGRDVIIVVGYSSSFVLIVIFVLTLRDWIIPVARVVAEVPMSNTSQLEIPVEGIELALRPPPVEVERIADAAGIKILGVTLLPEGRIEVRGEVQPEQPTDLSALHVEVTLDGENQVGFIDANTRTWKVFFEPSHSPGPGEKLNLKAVLVGAKQNGFSVQPAGPIS